MWKVFKNPVMEDKPYRVGRKIREDEPLHSGNVQYYTDYMDSKEDAQRLCDSLNKEMEESY